MPGELKLPFPRMTYEEAQERFGFDKPDLRFALELNNLTAAFAGTSFKVFAEVLARGDSIYGLGCRRRISSAGASLTRWPRRALAQGARARVGEDRRRRLAGADRAPSGRRRAAARRQAAGLEAGDTLLMARARRQGAADAGRAAPPARRQVQAARPGALRFLWIVDFPLFDYSEEERRMVSVNHPFTAPHPDDLALLATDAAQGSRARLRHGAERPGDGRRLDSYP